MNERKETICKHFRAIIAELGLPKTDSATEQFADMLQQFTDKRIVLDEFCPWCEKEFAELDEQSEEAIVIKRYVSAKGFLVDIYYHENCYNFVTSSEAFAFPEKHPHHSVNKRFKEVLEKLEIIMSQGVTASQALADLTAAVQQISQTEASILTAQQSLDAAIQVLIAAKNAGTGVDPAAIESLVGQLNTANTSLQSALTDINNQTAAANPPAAQ